MRRKELSMSASSPENFIKIFNGHFELTHAEVAVLSQFMLVHLALKKARIQVNAFSTDMKKRVARRMGKSNYHTLNTYIKALADKGAITKIEGGYAFHEWLEPTGEREILIKLT